MPPFRFASAEADRATSFFPRYLTYSKGRFGGRPFELADWQSKIVAEIFGRQVFDAELEDWVRQIRTAYVEIPRKNGKTELGAGIALKMLFADGENGAEIYSVAEDLDQANKCFAAARIMVENHPELSARATCWKRLIEHENGGIYRIIPGDAAGNHGHNPSAVIFDELHTQRDRELWDVMTSGGGTRTQPLTVAFSTAGTDRDSICWEMHERGEKGAKGLIDDPRFYYVRFGIGEGEDWEDETVWRRHNPALGNFLLTSFLRSEYADAKLSPGRQNVFRNLYLNEWTQQQSRWIDMKVWDGSAGSAAEPDLRGKPCFGGLHLGPSSGISAWVLAFPQSDERVVLLPRFFVPRKEATDGRNAAVYQAWARDGLIEITDGDVTDYAHIRDVVVKDAGRFDLRALNIRKTFLGSETATTLVDWFGEERVIGFAPTYPGFAAATREFDRLLRAAKLHHGGNPVMRWMADNVVARFNLDGDIKPDVEASPGDISGIVAALMALDLCVTTQVDSGDPLVAVVDV